MIPWESEPVNDNDNGIANVNLLIQFDVYKYTSKGMFSFEGGSLRRLSTAKH